METEERPTPTLGQFTLEAAGEKIAQRTHGAWLRSRQEPTDALAARALELIDKASGRPVESGDELPVG